MAERAARERIEADLVELQHAFGEAIEPLVRAPRDDFWAAVEWGFGPPEAIDLVETHFTFTDPVERHRDAFAFRTSIDPGEIVGGAAALAPTPTITIEYTDEMIQATRVAEERVVRKAKPEVRERFASSTEVGS